MLFAIAADAIGRRLRRAILALVRSAPQDVPPEFFKFPLF